MLDRFTEAARIMFASNALIVSNAGAVSTAAKLAVNKQAEWKAADDEDLY